MTKLNARFLNTIDQIPAAEWNGLVGDSYPFLQHEFLDALEKSGSVSKSSGWIPSHLVVKDETGELVAAAPAYLKDNSYGEYVFDWSWADAWRRHGQAYYPKLLSAIPFTPATGPRLCVAEGESRAEVYRWMCAAVRQFAAGEELVKVEAWWEDQGRIHKSILRDKAGVAGGTFETLRYLTHKEDTDQAILVTESTFHPSPEHLSKASSKFKPAFIRWEYEKE